MWNDAYIEDRVLSADPLELVCLLYQHALDSVYDARQYLAAGDIAARSRAISRAIAAISELDASLDHAAGGEISRNLAELYCYMRQRLTEANLQQQDRPLAEVGSLLATLLEAWSATRLQAAAPEPNRAGAFPPPQVFNETSFACEHNWSA
jgi:flagellar secretion chaperone FliS